MFYFTWKKKIVISMKESMFSFTDKLEQADLGKGTHSRMLSLAWEVQLSQWGPGDRLTRGGFLCLG